MPATPSWPSDSGVRLFVDQLLSEGAHVQVEGSSAHYLLGVMRLKVGAHLRMFDDRTGEWLGAIVRAGKRDLDVRLIERTRERKWFPTFGLAPRRSVAPAMIGWSKKPANWAWRGLRRSCSVAGWSTASSIDKLRAHMIEAAEQCGRTALPVLDGEMALKEWLAAIGDRPLYFADEAGGVPMRDAMKSGAAAILIGPEGGFDDSERALILAHPSTIRISLGPLILRADTAAIAAIAAWLALTR